MPRTIYLAVFSNGARPAHFSIFIPTSDKDTQGKIIHVTGNPATGFFLEFKRNYDFKDELRKYQTTPLAQVDEQHISDTCTVGNGEVFHDTTARDRLESVATTVRPPGRSPNPFDPSAPNCQTWMRDCVQELVEQGFVLSSASLVVENAPKVLP